MNTQDMPIVLLTGTALERGRQYGETLREKIQGCVAGYFASLEAARGTAAPPYLQRFIMHSGYEAACERHAPEFLAEVRGLAEGARISLIEALSLQLIDEEWAYARRQTLSGLSEPGGGRCTAIGYVGPESAVLGQNMDIARWCDGFQVLLDHRPADGTPPALVFSIAGCIGLCGLNSAAVGVCTNTLLELDSRSDGLPVLFVVRGILAQRTLESAVQLVNSIPHASGQNYLIGSQLGIRSLECSATRVVACDPLPGGACFAHTNHAIVNDDNSFSRSRMPGASIAALCGSPTSELRLAACRQRFADSARTPTLRDLFNALASKDDPRGPICRDGMPGSGSSSDAHIGYTVGSLVYELTESPVLHVAAGPPSVAQYKKVGFVARG